MREWAVWEGGMEGGREGGRERGREGVGARTPCHFLSLPLPGTRTGFPGPGFSDLEIHDVT